jgi:serine/threonine protein kinase
MSPDVAEPECAKTDSVSTGQSFANLLEQATRELQQTGDLNLEALIRAHPQHADQLRDLLPAMAAMASWARDPKCVASDDSSPSCVEPVGGILGDFRIIREIGRGGMGVVYEAEQISLNRRVALKILPLAAMLNCRRLERFRHEAQAAAMLRHPHIVTVYSVGCERGVHYYAMDYIEGPSLAEVVAQLRISDCGFNRHAGSLIFTPQSAIRSPQPEIETVAVLSTFRTTQPAEFFRTVARLGIQAAEALDYAHQMGVVHRDVKPSNLLLDTQGNLWITDFGLAMTQADAGLTMTGDLLGTLRYMSPEQAAGKRLSLDHRTDVYSLGITLYELLTGRPAFDTIARGELLRSIADVEPPPLRKLVPAIPADLETIVHKAIEKDAADRYVTAQKLAEDLRRFAENRAIQARPPTGLDRLRKLVRRHRVASTTAAVAALLILIVGVAIVADRRRQILETQRFLAASVQTGLVGYWPLDGDGTDRSLLGHDLRLKGGVGFAPGLFGQSLDLHGNPNTYAQRLPDDPEYDFGDGDFTIQIWVNFYSTSPNQVLIEKFSGNVGPGWTFSKPENNVLQFFHFTPCNSAPQTIPVNVWQHLVVCRKDDAIRIWSNGRTIVSSYCPPISKSTSPLYIGRRSPTDARSSLSLDGRLDEVAIWNRALTDNEIAYLHNGSLGNRIVEQ